MIFELITLIFQVRSKGAILEAAKLTDNYINDTLIKWMKSSLVRDELCNLYKTLEDETSLDVLNHCLKSNSTRGKEYFYIFKLLQQNIWTS